MSCNLLLKSALQHLKKKSFLWSKRTCLVLASFSIVSVALANPQGGTVVGGAAVISNTGSTTNITQGTQQAIINWNSFSINKNETTNFNQPANGAILNRVTGSSASQIYGKLNANASVFIVNQAGIFFQPGSVVNVGALVASTTDITNANFMAGHYVFDQPNTKSSNPSIVNSGTINASDMGLVALMSATVINNGTIKANLGNIVLGSGSKFTLDFYGDQLINFSVDAPATNGSIQNNGTLQSNGGVITATAQVNVTAKSACNVVDNAIQMKGVAIADSVSQGKNGEIILSSNGGVEVSGKLSASGKTAGSSGGRIQISAKTVDIESTALVDASGDAGGGSVTLQGVTDASGIQHNASIVDIDPFSRVTVNAINSGSAGNVNIAGDYVLLEGNLSASALGSDPLSFGGAINVNGGALLVSPFANISASGNVSGGFINVGGNPYSTTANTNSSYVLISPFAKLVAQGTAAYAFGGSVNASADNLYVYGNLDVSSTAMGASGGGINLNGANITVGSTALLNANGDSGGGSIIIGSNPLVSSTPSTTNLYIMKGSLLEAKSQGSTQNSYGFGGLVATFAVNTTLDSKIDVSAAAAGSQSSAGEVSMFGSKITLTGNANINATGDASGGYVRIGGDQLGQGPNPNSDFVNLNAGSVIDASALNAGPGGFVNVFAANTLNFNGSIYARGGANAGDGGTIALTGVQHLNNNGHTDVSAPNGAPGTVVAVGAP